MNAFVPAWWLPGPHLQTLWPVLFRRRPRLQVTRERLELPDGDFLDLSWSGPDAGPLVLLLHGLEGGINSHYMSGIMLALNRRGWRAVLLHFRNCGPEPNRLARSYHSGETGDLHHVVELLCQRLGSSLFGCIGYSLGGNVLLKWLGEQGPQSRVRLAVAVSVPFRLAECARRLDSGFSRLYQRHLLASMRASYQRKLGLLPPSLRLDVGRLGNIHSFDDRITAPLHGFAGADDYYRRCSSRGFLQHIRTPTLILHARDDPFMYPATAPSAEELPPAVRLELSQAGGHLGFVSGPNPWRASYWLEERICNFLDPAQGRGEP